MGMCDVIPGVSGWTIAFITGIYDRLLDALNNINKKALTLLLSGQWKALRSYIYGGFLLQVVGGILLSIILFAGIVERWLKTYPVAVWAFFFGLLLASAVVIARTVHHRRRHWLLWVIGLLAGRWLTSIPLMQAEPSMLSTFGAGAIAIMAMILPWISGSYILLMLNHYRHVISIVTTIIYGVIDATKIMFSDGIWAATDLLLILPREMMIVFVLGAVVGLITFAKLLFWLKARYYQSMVSFLVWVMIGALHTVRPWKETLSTYTDRHGDLVPLQQINIMPETWGDAFVWVSCALCGIALMLLIVFFSGNLQNEK